MKRTDLVQSYEKCELCGMQVFFRELPSGHMLAYSSAYMIHRCCVAKQGSRKLDNSNLPLKAERSVESESDLFDITDQELGYAASQDRQNPPHARELFAKDKHPAIEWSSPLLRRSVLEWSKLDATQYVLALPYKEEVAIRFEQEEWYVRGRIEGALISPKFFRGDREALIYAEKHLWHLGKQLLVQVRREDHWRLNVATPIQRAILKNYGYPMTHCELSKGAASIMIRQYVTHRR